MNDVTQPNVSSPREAERCLETIMWMFGKLATLSPASKSEHPYLKAFDRDIRPFGLFDSSAFISSGQRKRAVYSKELKALFKIGQLHLAKEHFIHVSIYMDRILKNHSDLAFTEKHLMK
jgi:hypothetical protein